MYMCVIIKSYLWGGLLVWLLSLDSVDDPDAGGGGVWPWFRPAFQPGVLDSRVQESAQSIKQVKPVLLIIMESYLFFSTAQSCYSGDVRGGVSPPTDLITFPTTGIIITFT